MSSVQIKDRLTEKLRQDEHFNIKASLYQFLADTDPNLTIEKWDKIQFKKLLPYLKKYSDSWSTMDAKDFTTTHTLIK
jgi:hypothetical protein